MRTVSKKGDQISNDIGIATFPTPAGWTSNRSDRSTSVVFLRTGHGSKPKEMISIDVGTPAAAGGARGSADALAKKFGGSVSELEFTIDEEQAFKVSVPQNLKQLAPRECVVTERNGKVCMIIGASMSQNEVWPTVSEIAMALRWN